MSITSIFAIAISAILVENFVLTHLLGLTPFIGASQKPSTAVKMGIAVTCATTATTAVTYAVDRLILRPLGVEYLQTVVFVLIIAGAFAVFNIVTEKRFPKIKKELGNLLPLATINSAVLGVALLAAQSDYNFIQAVVYGFAAGVGFLLATALFSALREKLEFADYPKCFEGFPIALVTAGLLALAFSGFNGMRIF